MIIQRPIVGLYIVIAVTVGSPAGLAADKEYAEAVNLIKRKKYTVARTLLSAIVGKDDSPKVRYALGYCCEKTGKKDEAMEHYRLAVAQNEDKGVDPDEAAKALKRLVKMNPEVGAVLEAAYELERKSGQSDSAFIKGASRLLYEYALTPGNWRKQDTGAATNRNGGGSGSLADSLKARHAREKALGYRLRWHKQGAVKGPDGRYYLLFEQPMTWKQAFDKCKDMGGYLATVTSREEHRFLADLARRADGTYFWVGGQVTDRGPVWITGEQFPDRDEVYSSIKSVKSYISLYSSGLRNDYYYSTTSGYTSRTYKRGFICEWEK